MNDITVSKLELQLSALGFEDSEINTAFNISNESIYNISDRYPKNLYICLYSPKHGTKITGALGPLIQKVTKSDLSHSSWSIESSGSFHSMAAPGKIIENLNTLENIAADKADYNVYKIPITEMEFSRAHTLWINELEKLHYSVLTLLKMGTKLLFGKSPDELFKGFNDSDINKNTMVCSTYVIASLCLSAPRYIQYFRDNNFSISAISPANIQKVPGIQYLFSGNLVFPFDRWKHLFEKKYGPLPN